MDRLLMSPQYREGEFTNSYPPGEQDIKSSTMLKKSLAAENTAPPVTLPVIPINKKFIVSQQLRVTWLGHAAVLIEIEGKLFLTDPALSERASPFSWIGPKRFHPSPVNVEELPLLDGVIISHDHYDHLDYQTIKRLRDKTKRFYVPLGVGAHLRHWGIPDEKISETDWNESVQAEHITLITLPARHSSGRSFKRNQTLWASWLIKSPRFTVYFGGDSGMFPGYKEFGELYGPIDITLLPIGAYDPMWPDIHLNPEEAVEAHIMLKGKMMIPIHWGTYNLAFHPWSEPADRLTAIGKEENITYIIPRAGEPVTPASVSIAGEWWKEYTLSMGGP